MNETQLRIVKELCANYKPIERSSWFDISFWNGDREGRTKSFDKTCSVRDFNLAYLDGNFLAFIEDEEDVDGREPWIRYDVSGITDILICFYVYSSEGKAVYWDERGYIVTIDGSFIEIGPELMSDGPTVLANMQLSTGNTNQDV